MTSFMYKISRIGKYTRDRKQIRGIQVLGKKGIGVSVWDDRKFQNQIVVMVEKHCEHTEWQ